jgi:uncharacterized membrane protein required for colicin V production
MISFLLDAAVVLAVAFPLIRGYRRGFKKCAFSLLSFAVAVIAAFVISDLFAQPVYERFVRDRAYEMCLSAAQKYDPAENVDKILVEYGADIPEQEIRTALTSAESLPESIAKLAENYGVSGTQTEDIRGKISDSLNSDVPETLKSMAPAGVRNMVSLDLSDAQIYDAARACAQSPEEAADYAEENFVAPICTAIVKSVLFFLSAFLVSLIMKLAFFIFGFDFSRRPETFGDRFGGMLFGAVSAAANVLVITAAVGFVEQAGTGYFDIQSLNSKIFLPIFNALY